MNKDDKRSQGQPPQRPDQSQKTPNEKNPAREGYSNQKDVERE